MERRAEVIVVGAGVAGLGAALSLARAGHRVTIVERDPTPLPATADEAFEWDRRGAPQVRHSHAFLARLRNLLRDHHPDVLADLLAAGATELAFGRDLPPTITNYEPLDGDDELVMLACRRTTFEWVLRRAVIAQAGVEIVTGRAVTGLVTDNVSSAGDARPNDDVSSAGPPLVRGVHLDDGSSLEADLVVVANGRRSSLPDWVAAIGGRAVPEQLDDTGIVYASRFYRLRQGHVLPARNGAIGGDLGYVKYGVFVGDNDTFSITLAVPTDDARLRHLLDDETVFECAAGALTATADYVDGRAEPITGVHTMAGLVNRWRDWVIDGQPAALGVVPIGDAQLCTNPLYGRGCSTGFWHAHLLAEAVAAHPHDLLALALALDTATRDHILPWYRASVTQDREARRVAAAILAGDDPDADADDPRAFMRGVLREGLLPALRLDAVVLRGFLRSLNLLTAPDALATDPDIGARVLAVWQDRAQRPAEPSLGPPRDELIALLEQAILA